MQRTLRRHACNGKVGQTAVRRVLVEPVIGRSRTTMPTGVVTATPTESGIENGRREEFRPERAKLQHIILMYGKRSWAVPLSNSVLAQFDFGQPCVK